MRNPAPTEQQLADEADLLSRQLVFNGVSVARLEAFALACDRVNFDSGQTVFRQGALPDVPYFLLSGSADVPIDTRSGEMKVATIQRTMVGDESVFSGDIRKATLRAITPLETLCIHKDELAKLFSEMKLNQEMGQKAKRDLETIREGQKQDITVRILAQSQLGRFFENTYRLSLGPRFLGFEDWLRWASSS